MPPVPGWLDPFAEVIVADSSEEGKCPGLESFRELRQPNVRMLYRASSMISYDFIVSVRDRRVNG